MTEFNFKEGDKVYYPMATNEVLTITSDWRVYYLGTDADTEGTTSATLTPSGGMFRFHHNPAFFPATQEWYDKLVHVYPDLEKPPKRKGSKEIIQAMLDDGNEGVLCWVSDNSTKPCSANVVTIITRVHERYVDFERNTWLYATPIYPLKSLKQTIIDFVDGEVVLEN